MFQQAEYFRKLKPTVSISLLNNIESELRIPTDSVAYSKLNLTYSLVYFTAHQWDSCLHYAKRQRDFSLSQQDTVRIIEAYRNLAFYYSEFNEYVLQEDALLQALKLLEIRKDTLGIITACTSLGSVLKFAKRMDLAKNYLHQAYQYALRFGNRNRLAITSLELGTYCLENGAADSSLHYLHQAKELFLLDKNQYSAATAIYYRAKAWMLLSDFSKAHASLDSAVSWLSQLNNTIRLINCNLLRGEILVKEKKYSEGLKLLLEVYKQHRGSLNLQACQNLFNSLCRIYLHTGDSQQALKVCDSAQILKDSLLSISVLKEAQQMEIAYRSEKKEKELIALRHGIELNTISLAHERMKTYGLASGILLLSLLLFGLFRMYSKANQQKAIIEKNLIEKETLLKEIHHRVKNNLQFISSLLNLQSRHLKDQNALKALREGQNRVKSMALIHQNLYQEGNLVGVDCKIYFESLIKGLFNSYNISQERIVLETDIASLTLDIDTMIPLGLIVNELISNSLKHAFTEDHAGFVKISLKENDGVLHLSVHDNGIGLSDQAFEQLGKSFGYRLIQSLTDQLCAQYTLDRSQGTKVTIALKKSKLNA